MKSVIIFLLLTLFLDASYIRAIRVTSFLDEKRAEKGINQLKAFVKSHKNLNQLEKKLHFQYTTHKIDKHYVIVIEPLTDKIAVQEILDTLRTKYKKAYPRKLATMPKVFTEEELEALTFIFEPEVKIEQTSPTPKIISHKQIEKPKIIIKEKVEIKKEKEKENQIPLHDNSHKINKHSEINTQNSDISTLLILLLLTLLIVSFFYIYFSRKKKNRLHSKTLTEIILDDIDTSSEKNLEEVESLLPNKEAQAIMNKQFDIKYEELNTTVGLESYAKDLESYKNALKDFQTNYFNSAILLEKLCNNSDFDKALTIIQTLKEETLQIGALHIHECVKSMDDEITLGENSHWEKSIWIYGITFKKLSIEIDHFINSEI